MTTQVLTSSERENIAAVINYDKLTHFINSDEVLAIFPSPHDFYTVILTEGRAYPIHADTFRSILHLIDGQLTRDGDQLVTVLVELESNEQDLDDEGRLIGYENIKVGVTVPLKWVDDAVKIYQALPENLKEMSIVSYEVESAYCVEF